MSDLDSDRSADTGFSRGAMTVFLQIGALMLLLVGCFLITAPFIGLIVWGLIIAVALYPGHLALSRSLGGSQKGSATVLVIVGLLLLIAPTWMMVDSGVESARGIAHQLRDSTLSIPPPRESIADWPLVGQQIYDIWSGASSNLEKTLTQYDAQLAAFGEAALRNLGAGALGVLGFAASIIVAGVFLVSGESGHRLSIAIAASIAGSRKGTELVDMSIATIRSVMKGVLGVAVVQTALAVLGLIIMDVPGAGIWGAIILILAVMQLPPWLVMAPIAVWVFSVADPVPATIFAVYSLIVSVSDMFLKPLFLGRGVDVPMPVILIGAIGGAIATGVVGLFLGAVVLAIGYRLLVTWIYPDIVEDAIES